MNHPYDFYPHDLVSKHPAENTSWLTTVSGKRIKLPNLHASQVSSSDIAHALSMTCRYQGMCSDFYSVAEHSILVADLVDDAGFDELTVRCALLHDAHEAYIGDFPTPFKYMIEGLRDFENQVEDVVRDAFNLPGRHDDVWKIVEHFDILALHYESSAMLNSPGWVKQDLVDQVTATGAVFIHNYPAKQAAKKFGRRLQQIGIGLGGND
jgi:hypothetical protein